MLALGVIATLSVHFGCVTSKPEMAWVRTDGQRIVDDPALLQQGKTDIAFCHANLDAGVADEAARQCRLRRDMLSCGKIRRRRREQHTPPLRLNAGRYRLPGNYRSCLNGRQPCRYSLGFAL